jgi:hypothetical protein
MHDRLVETHGRASLQPGRASLQPGRASLQPGYRQYKFNNQINFLISSNTRSGVISDIQAISLSAQLN